MSKIEIYDVRNDIIIEESKNIVEVKDMGLQGPQGIPGAKINSAEFVDDDMVFGLDDSSSVVLTNAKPELKGDKGDKGDAATLDIGTTSTGDPGTDASVSNSGTIHEAIFDFTIPRGDKGEKGLKGDQGFGLEYNWDNTQLGVKREDEANYDYTDLKGETGDKGDTGDNIELRTDSGYIQWKETEETTWNNLIELIELKGDKGDKGDTGDTIELRTHNGYIQWKETEDSVWTNLIELIELKGDKGDTGDAATLDVGTTTTGAAGTDASVSNSGTIHEAVFDFTIPRGDKGEQGYSIDYDWDGTQLGIKREDETDYDYTDLKGEKGDKGFYWKGEWSAGTYYEFDVVEKDGSSWIANKETTETPSDIANDWDIVAQAGGGIGDLVDVNFVPEDLVVNVGPNPSDNFETINEAIDYLVKNFYPIYKKAGIMATIYLSSDFVMEEQVLVNDIDLGWIKITNGIANNEKDIEDISKGLELQEGKQSKKILTIKKFENDVTDINSHSVRMRLPNGERHYFWFNVDNTGTNPNGMGTGHEVEIDSVDDEDDVIEKLETAIDDVDGFSVTRVGRRLTIVFDDYGEVEKGVSSSKFLRFNYWENLFRHSDTDSVPSGAATVLNVTFEANDWETNPYGFDFDGKVVYQDNEVYRFYRNAGTLPPGKYTLCVFVRRGDGTKPILGIGQDARPRIQGTKSVVYEENVFDDVWFFRVHGEIISASSNDIGLNKYTNDNNNLIEATGFMVVEGHQDIYPEDYVKTDGGPDTLYEEGQKEINQVKITTTNHGYSNGDRIIVRFHEGILEERDYNGIWYINEVTDNTFEIDVTEHPEIVYDETRAGITDTGINTPLVVVPVSREHLTEVWEFFYRPAFGVCRGKLPLIDCLFEMDESPLPVGVPEYMSYLDGLCATDSGEINVTPFSGFINAHGTNLYGTRGSRLNLNDAIADFGGRHGIWAYATTIINARRARASDCGWVAEAEGKDRIDEIDEMTGCGVIATRGSVINFESGRADNNYSDNIHSEHGASIVASYAIAVDSKVGNNMAIRTGGSITRDRLEYPDRCFLRERNSMFGCYTFEQVNNMIMNEGYIPVTSMHDLDNIRNEEARIFGSGSPWIGTYIGGLDKKYIQLMDIDLGYDTRDPNGLFYNEGEGWQPIASFSGIYDGCSYTISNIYLNSTGTYVGLFGNCANTTNIIRNLKMENVDVTRTRDTVPTISGVGPIIARTDGLVENCYTSGFIYSYVLDTSMYGFCSGIVGRGDSNAVIQNCISDCVIYSNANYFGGIIGHSYSTIVRYCLFLGILIAPEGTTDVRVIYNGISSYYNSDIINYSGVANNGVPLTTNELLELRDASWDDNNWDYAFNRTPIIKIIGETMANRRGSTIKCIEEINGITLFWSRPNPFPQEYIIYQNLYDENDLLGSWEELARTENNSFFINEINLPEDLSKIQFLVKAVYDTVNPKNLSGVATPSNLIDGEVEDFGDGFVILVNTMLDSFEHRMILPLKGTNITIDWGDGTVETGINANNFTNFTHNYEQPSPYIIKISNITGVRFYGENDSNKVVRILQWGNIEWTDFTGSFFNCSNLRLFADDIPNLSNVTNITMFRDSGIGDSPEIYKNKISDWDVSNVEVFGSGTSSPWGIFSGVSNFNVDLTGWNVSSGKNFGLMFRGASDFNQNLGNWDIGNMENARWMFENSGMSTENYTDTLVGWANYVYNNSGPYEVDFTKHDDFDFDASRDGGANFDNAGEAREYLTKSIAEGGAEWNMDCNVINE